MRPCLGFTDVQGISHPCGEVTPQRRCQDCQRAQWRTRGGGHARGYTRKWRTVSRVVRRRQPWCDELGCTAPATDVDHVVPLRANGRSVMANARPLCRRHHAAKTKADKELYP